MNIALVGASGNAGSRIMAELSERGHRVTAIARHPENIKPSPNVTAEKGDLFETEAFVDLLRGHELVISAIHFSDSDADVLINAVKQSGAKRYLVVGGAGSLEVAPGVMLVSTPKFPEAYKSEALKGGDFLERLREETDLDWTFLSPSAMFVPGARTGVFRLGKDALISNEAGSSISFEDYAVALVDEIEHPKHRRQRFTVGY